ncbi:unnamed protein product [Parnassius apollo]|uniref:(apollo) hypothetical protein n=1 Tax=Parnassius apollo TaxID=110799 RepID=A0A8S3YAI3_PARAO|nr:unnamed protein product [Parnassius apollo]
MGASWMMLRRWLPAACAALLIVAELSCASNEDMGEDFSPQDGLYERCIREDDREGMCVPPHLCYENYTLATGGVILTYNLRDGSVKRDCPKWMWCCTNDTAPPQKTLPDTPGCVRVYPEEVTVCPWCVALYRPGGDVSRGQRTESGLYCAGALVGARVVLTSATCVRSAGAEATWARVPASAAPARRYSVLQKITHENYSTGTHANDFGLLVLNEDVQWDEGPDLSKGACIGLQSQLNGPCYAAGFNMLEDIVMAEVSVRSGNCRTRRRGTDKSVDVACGAAIDMPCPIVPGAPVVCPTVSDEQGGLVIAGVARQACQDGSAKLGKIEVHAQWLELQLQRLGVDSDNYMG